MNDTLDGNAFAGWKKKAALFLAGQGISLFGSALVQYAIIWYITLETKSGIMFTIATICSSLPQIVLSLYGGVWADRYNRKRLIILADAMIAVSTLIVAVFFLTGNGSFPLLMLISAVRSAGGGIHTPAVSALIPQIVPEDQLMRVNGINQTVQSIIFLASPAAAGALYATSQISNIFFIDVVTAVIGIGFLLLISVPAHQRAAEEKQTSHMEDFKEGLDYMKSNKFIRYLLIFNAIIMFLIVPFMYFTPLLVARSFGEEVWRLTANEIVFFVGATTGGIVVSTWGGFKNKILTIVFSTALCGVFGAAMGLASNFYVYLTFMGLTGALMPFINTASTVLIQQRVDSGMQGRVFSFIALVTSSVMPAGMIIFGPLADITKIEYMLIVMGVLMAAMSLLIASNKALREI